MNALRITHWSRIGDFGYGDVKATWELARFGFTFALVLSLLSHWGDERWADVFWRLADNWLARQSAPARSPLEVRTGSELTADGLVLRPVLAFRTAGPRRQRLVHTLRLAPSATGSRIENNLAYALSQKTTTASAKGWACGTIGLLFPELKRAENLAVLRGRTSWNGSDGSLFTTTAASPSIRSTTSGWPCRIICGACDWATCTDNP